jgi:hypothetical protein|tara:strand:+ start:251 stop:529 length:279 start_codon:yes stop_codon:yes gene_type:complete
METLFAAPFIIAFVLGIFFLFTAILRWLWNMTMPEVFDVKTVSFWQAFRIMLISALLFQGGPSDELRRLRGTVEDINKKFDTIIEMEMSEED